jgi:hypothetical protein
MLHRYISLFKEFVAYDNLSDVENDLKKMLQGDKLYYKDYILDNFEIYPNGFNFQLDFDIHKDKRYKHISIPVAQKLTKTTLISALISGVYQ